LVLHLDLVESLLHMLGDADHRQDNSLFTVSKRNGFKPMRGASPNKKGCIGTSEERGIVPIVRKLLQNNHIFALEFREGFLFGRVVHRRICQWKPWYLIDATGTAVDISASSAQAELRFRDPRNPQNSIPFLNTSTAAGFPWFFHGAIGIKPQQVYMYLRYPEGQVIPGKFPNIDPTRPTSGDNTGFVNGVNSPYEEPTDWCEIIIQPSMHLGAEYYNKDDARNHQPCLNLLFALYWVQFFQPATHAKQISDIALRRYEGARAAFLKVGFGDLPHDMGDTLIQDWKVAPMKLDEAAALGGGR